MQKSPSGQEQASKPDHDKVRTLQQIKEKQVKEQTIVKK